MTGNRAQTTLDFAIAMGVFLLAVAFVFTFIPSITGPFIDGHQDRPVIADRTASHLSEGALGDVDEPFIVREACATAFFGEEDMPEGCDGMGDGETHERLGIHDRVGFNIELVHVDPEAQGGDRHRTVCYDEDADAVVHEDNGDCDQLYQIGDESLESDSTTVSRRVVTMDSCEFGVNACDVTLLVEVY